MITRAVLLDVAGLDGGAHLNPSRVVAPEDLERAADNAKLAIEPGDIVMIRTGWAGYFEKDNARYLAGEPGIDLPAARWLTEQRVVAIGCDNMAVEVLPNPDNVVSMPVHQHALVEAGVHLIENLALDELARDGLAGFCFILLATKLRGATGSSARPVALVSRGIDLSVRGCSDDALRARVVISLLRLAQRPRGSVQRAGPR